MLLFFVAKAAFQELALDEPCSLPDEFVVGEEDGALGMVERFHDDFGFGEFFAEAHFELAGHVIEFGLFRSLEDVQEEHTEGGRFHIQEERLQVRGEFVVAGQRNDICGALFRTFEEFLELVPVIDDGVVDEKQAVDALCRKAGNVVSGAVLAVGLQLQVALPHAKVESAIFGEEKLDVVFLQELVGLI